MGMAHWSFPSPSKPPKELRGICNVCGVMSGVYYINRACWSCHQGEFIHAAFYHVRECPLCNGKDGLPCNVCWGMGFTAIPTEEQEDIHRGCGFHNAYCINPWGWWKKVMEEGTQGRS